MYHVIDDYKQEYSPEQLHEEYPTREEYAALRYRLDWDEMRRKSEAMKQAKLEELKQAEK